MARQSHRAQMADPLWATYLAARWAQRIGLRPGNLWEPAIVRHLEKEAAALGGERHARAFVTALWANRLGVAVE